jgi:ABC-type cobalamin transport system permease subunit
VRAYNKLMISLGAAFGLINVLLAFLGQNDLSVYFIVNAIAYMIITLIFVYLNPRARASLNAVSGIIFAGFLVIVTFKVIEILK